MNKKVVINCRYFFKQNKYFIVNWFNINKYDIQIVLFNFNFHIYIYLLLIIASKLFAFKLSSIIKLNHWVISFSISIYYH